MSKIIILTAVFFITFTQPIFAASHHPQEFLNQISGAKDEGEQIVQHFCINCHAQKPLIPLGAPRIGVTADWAPRLKQQMAILFKHTSEGINAMPARGGCFECTDEQLMLSILAMLPEPLVRVKSPIKTTKKPLR